MKTPHLNFTPLIFAILCCIFIMIPSLSTGDSMEYIYDDTGRLVRAANTDDTRILYQYDKVGNLISVYKETSASQALPPELQGIEPGIFLIGETYNVIITGRNLLATESITSGNSAIAIKFIAAIDTKINAVLSIADTASPGQANITVATSYGSANIAVDLYEVILAPEAVSLFPLSTAVLTVSANPSLSEDLKVRINNHDPGIMETPGTVAIPAGGSAGFTIKALKSGAGVVSIGSAKTTVYVIGGDESESGALLRSAPVSVSMSRIPGNTRISSSLVSISIGGPDNTRINSSPVSVSINGIPDDTRINSSSVSVSINGIPDDTGINSSSVSVSISRIPDNSKINSSPVSVEWHSVSGAVTVSVPVSVDLCAGSPVRVVGESTEYYSSLQTAYDAASDGNTIEAQAVELSGDLDVNRDISVTLQGGYDCDYSAIIGDTALNGNMTVNSGTIIIENLILK